MTTVTRRLLLGLILALLPASAAFADMAPQITAVGNGEIIANILTATKLLVSESGYHKMIMLICLGGFMFIATSSTMGAVKPQEIIIYFVTIVLLTTMTFRATMNVTVHDTVNNRTEVVSGVPLIVALPATVTSQIGDFMLRGVESFFTYSNGGTSASSPLSMSNSGQFNLIGQMIVDGNQVSINDKHIRSSMHAYVQDCVVPWMYRGYIDAKAMLYSKNLWPDLYNNSLSMMTIYYSDDFPQGVMIPCGSKGRDEITYAQARPGSSGGVGVDENGQDISTQVGAAERIAYDINKQAPLLVGQGFEGFQYTDAASFFEGAYASAYAYLAQSGPMTTSEIMRNNAVINTYSDVSRDVMSGLGSDGDGIVYAINAAEAVQGQKTGWEVGAEVFQKIMGYLYTVLQAFVMAIMPIVLVAFFVPSYGAKIAGTVIKMMIWLALWIPALGIVNFIVAGFLQQAIGPYLANGIDMSNMATITQQTRNAVIAAGFFGTSIPLITWGLVSSGSFALTQFLSEGAGAMQARTAAANIASSSISVGQQSYDNTNARKTDLASTFETGRHSPKSYESLGIGIQSEMGGYGASKLGQMQTQTHQQSEQRSENRQAGSIHQIADQISSSAVGSRASTIAEKSDQIAKWLTKDVANAAQRQQLESQLSEALQTRFAASSSSNMSDQGSQANAMKGSLGAGVKSAGGQGAKAVENKSVQKAEQGTSASEGMTSGRGMETKTGSGRDVQLMTAAEVAHDIQDSVSSLNTSEFKSVESKAQSLTDTESWSESLSYVQTSTVTTTSTAPVSAAQSSANESAANTAVESADADVRARAGDIENRRSNSESADADPHRFEANNSARAQAMASENVSGKGKVEGTKQAATSLMEDSNANFDRLKHTQQAMDIANDMMRSVNSGSAEGLASSQEFSNYVSAARGGGLMALQSALDLVDIDLKIDGDVSRQLTEIVKNDKSGELIGNLTNSLDDRMKTYQENMAGSTQGAHDRVRGNALPGGDVAVGEASEVGRDGDEIPAKGRARQRLS